MQAVVAIDLPRDIVPGDSSVRSRIEGDFLLIEIETPGTASPFWSGSANPTRVVTYSVISSLPKLSLVTAIGTESEKRVTLIPINVWSNRMAVPTPPAKLPLKVDEEEVGWVTLFTEEGAINTHKAVYSVRRGVLATLTSPVLVIVGDPFARQISISAEP